MAPRILIVEDSRTFSSLLANRIRRETDFEVIVAASLRQAQAILATDTDFLVALLDINLPDAPDGEVVDAVTEKSIPAIIFTGELEDALRDRFWAKRIVDYVLKESVENIDYLLTLIRRLERNPGIQVLVVDDSRSYRNMLVGLLSAHRYQVLEAEDGPSALKALEEHPDVKLATVDYNMPGMDGFSLTREIRRRFSKDMLAIIGVSGQTGSGLSARFIKSGANDYLNKPILTEEFYTRITQNLEMLERFDQIREMADKDYLTQVHNRRYFFSAGSQFYAAQRRRGGALTLAMLDIDHFKQVNDTHGHDAGDAVLQQMAALLASRFRNADIVARFGGEEFCVLAMNMDAEAASTIFDELRQAFEQTPACFEKKCIPYTVSIGVCSLPLGSLAEMVKQADLMLYKAKAEGRNRVALEG